MENRVYRVNLATIVALILAFLLVLNACQTTADDNESALPASLIEPTDLPAPTEEATATPVPTPEPTSAPPTPEPTKELSPPSQEVRISPPARGLHAMAYDSESDRIIMFGGELDQIGSWKIDSSTWAYDAGNNLWTQMFPAKEPPGVYGQVMAYDSESDRVIMVGGGDRDEIQNVTWAYDFNANRWSEGTANPAVGTGAGMVYDSESDRMILFGGFLGTFGGGSQDITWAYDFNTDTWENMAPDISPEARHGHNMVYDVESDRVIVWEGEDFGDEYLGENVWTYDYNTNSWIEHDLEGAPILKGYEGYGAMVYDTESDRAISFGGGYYSGARIMDDMWVYDFNTDTWTEMKPEAGPGARTSHDMVYDSALDLVILFGGRDESFYKYSSETWVYDLNANTWTNMTME